MRRATRDSSPLVTSASPSCASSSPLDDRYERVSPGGIVIIDDFHLNGARRAVHRFREQHAITSPILPVAENYVFACRQGPKYGVPWHIYPDKIPQGAFWRKRQDEVFAPFDLVA